MLRTMTTPALTVTELPPNWALFVEGVVAGGSPADVAKSLNYAQPTPTSALLLRHPQVRKALVQATQARLEGEAGPLAVKVIMEVLSDDNAPAAVKAKLALGVMDRIQPPKDERPASDKPLSSMTVSELAEEVARLRSQAGILEHAHIGIEPMRDVTPG